MRLNGRYVAVWLFIALVSCSEEKLSRVGESCAKSADCEGDARCVANRCVVEDDGAELQVAVSVVPAIDPCAGASAFEGSWAWSTTVVGAKKDSMMGANGHYRMTVEVKGCELHIDLQKVGYSTRTLKPERIPKGREVLTYEALNGFDGMTSGDVVLVNERGASASMSVTLIVDKDTLWGSWSQEGETWPTGELWGALKGSRNSNEPLKYSHWNDQPCVVQCAMGCSAPKHEKSGTLSGVPYAACLEACDGSPRSASPICEAEASDVRSDADKVLPKGCKIRSEKGPGHYKVSCRRLRKKLPGWRLVHESLDNTHFSEHADRTYKREGWKLTARVECEHQLDSEGRFIRSVCKPKRVRLKRM